MRPVVKIVWPLIIIIIIIIVIKKLYAADYQGKDGSQQRRLHMNDVYPGSRLQMIAHG